jgi:hypothetical protein
MRYLRWSREGVTGLAAGVRMAAWPTGLIVGLGAEWLARSGQSLTAAIVDLAVGWTLIACGLLGWARRPQSRVGPLIALTGFAWFLGTLAESRIGFVAVLGSALVFLHRGPLCHAIIGYPSGRPAGRLGMTVVVAAYMYAAAVPLARSDVVTILVALAVLGAAIRGYARAAGPDRQARATAVAAAGALAVPLVGGSVWWLVGAGSGAEDAVLWGYDTVLVLIAVGFLADMSRGPWAQAAVTKLVVDLGGDSEAGTLRARLAHALGDRSLTIAYWLPEVSGYVDERGTRLSCPRPGREGQSPWSGMTAGRSRRLFMMWRCSTTRCLLTLWLGRPGSPCRTCGCGPMCSAKSRNWPPPGAGSWRPGIRSAAVFSSSCKPAPGGT